MVAALNGEFTVKRYISSNGEISLRAESNTQRYPDIDITEDIDFEVWGVVTHTIHRNR